MNLGDSLEQFVGLLGLLPAYDFRRFGGDRFIQGERSGVDDLLQVHNFRFL